MIGLIGYFFFTVAIVYLYRVFNQYINHNDEKINNVINLTNLIGKKNDENNDQIIRQLVKNKTDIEETNKNITKLEEKTDNTNRSHNKIQAEILTTTIKEIKKIEEQVKYMDNIHNDVKKYFNLTDNTLSQLDETNNQIKENNLVAHKYFHLVDYINDELNKNIKNINENIKMIETDIKEMENKLKKLSSDKQYVEFKTRPDQSYFNEIIRIINVKDLLNKNIEIDVYNHLWIDPNYNYTTGTNYNNVYYWITNKDTNNREPHINYDLLGEYIKAFEQKHNIKIMGNKLVKHDILEMETNIDENKESYGNTYMSFILTYLSFEKGIHYLNGDVYEYDKSKKYIYNSDVMVYCGSFSKEKNGKIIGIDLNKKYTKPYTHKLTQWINSYIGNNNINTIDIYLTRTSV